MIMAEKLSWTELRRAIAARAGVSEKKAGEFLAELQKQITEALKQDKVVKVNGLGTFKLQAVAPRKSVNVSTGEEMIIDGYNKVAFVPEAGVKELIEGRQTSEAKAVTTEADPIQKLGAQADEIVDILGELGQSPETKKKPAAKKKVSKVQKVQEVKEEPKVEEPVAETPKEEPKEEFYIPEALRMPIEPDEEEQKPKRYYFLRDTLICVVVLLLLLLIGYFFLRGQLSGWLEKLTEPKAVQTEQVVEAPQPDEVQEVQEVQEIAEWHYDQLLLTENITPGSRLAWIAKKHYGDRDLWPYIYMANKDRLTNPSDVMVGTPIRVPKLTEADRDKNSAQFMRIKAEAEAAIQE